MRPASLGRPARRLALAACLGSALVAAAGSQAACGPAPRISAATKAEAERLRARMSLDEEAAQVLLVGVSGEGKASLASLALLQSLPVGGVLLFGFNLPPSPEALAPLAASLQDAAAGRALDIPLIVALDHEGGAVFRFKGGGVTRLPPPAEVGARGPGYARALGRAAGRELRALGVNMALAPVVELLDDRNIEFLGNRSYGRDPARVDAAAGAFIEGLQEGGAASVAKHFPGNAAADPHRGEAFIAADRAAYERDYLPRFAAAVKRGVAAVMASHAVLPAIDPERQATFSPILLNRELKGKLGFEGVVLTDDLYMKAVAKDGPPERGAVEALAAGADLLMLSSGGGAERVRDAIVRAVEAGALPRARLDDAVRRILELKLRFDMGADLDPAVRRERQASYAGLLRENARDVARALEESRRAPAAASAGSR